MLFIALMRLFGETGFGETGFGETKFGETEQNFRRNDYLEKRNLEKWGDTRKVSLIYAYNISHIYKSLLPVRKKLSAANVS